MLYLSFSKWVEDGHFEDAVDLFLAEFPKYRDVILFATEYDRGNPFVFDSLTRWINGYPDYITYLDERDRVEAFCATHNIDAGQYLPAKEA